MVRVNGDTKTKQMQSTSYYCNSTGEGKKWNCITIFVEHRRSAQGVEQWPRRVRYTTVLLQALTSMSDNWCWCWTPTTTIYVRVTRYICHNTCIHTYILYIYIIHIAIYYERIKLKLTCQSPTTEVQFVETKLSAAWKVSRTVVSGEGWWVGGCVSASVVHKTKKYSHNDHL